MIDPENTLSMSEKQVEALRELINIGVGKGAAILNTMLNSHIQLQVPKLQILSLGGLQNELSTLASGRISGVSLGFQGAFSGHAELMFPSETAMALVNTLIGDAPTDLDFDSIRSGTLCEIGNVVLNGVMGTISNIFSSYFKYSVPEYIEDVADNILTGKISGQDLVILLAKTRFLIKELDIEGDIVLFFEVGAIDKLLDMVEAL